MKNVRPLIEVVRSLDALPDGTIHSRRPWTVDAPAWVGEDDAPAGFEYFLEVEFAKDAVEVWSAWRGGQKPTDRQACEAVIHYATHDAYQDVDEAGDQVAGRPVQVHQHEQNRAGQEGSGS